MLKSRRHLRSVPALDAVERFLAGLTPDAMREIAQHLAHVEREEQERREAERRKQESVSDRTREFLALADRSPQAVRVAMREHQDRQDATERARLHALAKQEREDYRRILRKAQALFDETP